MCAAFGSRKRNITYEIAVVISHQTWSLLLFLWPGQLESWGREERLDRKSRGMKREKEREGGEGLEEV